MSATHKASHKPLLHKYENLLFLKGGFFFIKIHFFDSRQKHFNSKVFPHFLIRDGFFNDDPLRGTEVYPPTHHVRFIVMIMTMEYDDDDDFYLD